MFLAVLFAMSLTTPTLFDFTVTDIDGKTAPLKAYKGEVVLVVNVASRCGLTPQYEGLESLYRAHKDQGFVVLGFPANDFNDQEPGTEAEIKEFCTTKFDVTFPMFAKVSVRGAGQHELFKWLVANAPYQDEIEWNFGKFLVGRDGMVVARFHPRDKPDDPKIVAAIKKELAKDR